VAAPLSVDPAYANADCGYDIPKRFADLQAATEGPPLDPDAAYTRADHLADLVATAQDLVVQQNAAADDYRFWSRKADSYVTALTVLAVAFCLFGLAQTMQAERLQRSLVLVGSLVLATCVAWSVLLLVS
jgi:hypothetical protein